MGELEQRIKVAYLVIWLMCLIASRINCSSDHATTLFGEKLKDQVEERLSFYETGETLKNAVVMEATSELKILQEEVLST